MVGPDLIDRQDKLATQAAIGRPLRSGPAPDSHQEFAPVDAGPACGTCWEIETL